MKAENGGGVGARGIDDIRSQGEDSIYPFLKRVLPASTVLLAILICSTGGPTIILLSLCAGHVALNVAMSAYLSRFPLEFRPRLEVAKNFVNVTYVSVAILALGPGTFLWTLNFLPIARGILVFRGRLARLGTALLLGLAAGAAEIWHGGPASAFLAPLIILLVPAILMDMFWRFFEGRLRLEQEWRLSLERSRELSRRLASVGSLAGGIAHEINTPVQFVGTSLSFVEQGVQDLLAAQKRYQGLASSALEGGGPALREPFLELKEIERELDVPFLAERIPLALDRAREGLERVGTIVNAMQRISWPGTDEKHLGDINELIQLAVTVTRSTWAKLAKLRLELGDLPPIPCYEGDLAQTFLGLILNAAEAVRVRFDGAEGGEISIHTSLVGEKIEILVIDNGCGIPRRSKIGSSTPSTPRRVGKLEPETA